MPAQASQLLAETADRVYRPRDRLSVDEWADRYRVLIAEASAEPGRWSTDRTPYLREIMRCWTDPGVHRIVLMFGSQLGKTECIYNCLGYDVDNRPSPTLFVYPNVELARSVNKDRLVPTIEASPRWAGHLTGSPQDVKGLQITFDSMPLWFVGSISETGMSSRPCGTYLADEIDKFPPRAMALIRQRTKTFPDFRGIETSTPSDEDVGVHKEYQTTDQRRYEVPCPHCGKYQELRWGQVRWDGGSNAEPEQAEATAHYQCTHCQERIDDHHKPRMLTRGVWAREGQRVETDENGSPIITGRAARPNASAVGFRLSSLYSPFLSFGAVVRKFADAGYQATPEFVNGELGEPWRRDRQKVELAEITRVCRPVSEGGYRLETCPPGVLLLTCTVDLQRASAYVVVRGWGERGLASWLIHHGQIACPEGHNLVELDGLLDMTFPVQFEGQTINLRPAAVGIDSGDGTRTDEVYEWCRRNGLARTFAVKGYDGSKMAEPQRVSRLGKDTRGRPLANQIQLLIVNTDHWKRRIVAALKLEAEAANAGVALNELASRFHLAEDTSPEYILQLTSEHRKTEYDRRTGKPKYVWALRPGRTNNHYLDAEVYGHALAHAAGVAGWTAERVRRILAGPSISPAPISRAESPGRARQARQTSPDRPGGLIERMGKER